METILSSMRISFGKKTYSKDYPDNSVLYDEEEVERAVSYEENYKMRKEGREEYKDRSSRKSFIF